MLDELKAKKPFLYEDSKGIVAISGEKAARVCSSKAIEWYESYKNIIVQSSSDANYIKKIMCNISSHAILLTGCYIIVDGKQIPFYGVKRIKTEEYWNELTNEEKKNLKNQLNMFERLYKKYIS